MTKTAFITGISGQDGAYLSKFLLEKGYRVIGGERKTVRSNMWRLKKLGIHDDVEVSDFDLGEFTNIYRAIEKNKVDELYNLAAQSYVSLSFEFPLMTADITGLGVARILEVIRLVNPAIRFYQASSSEMFGNAVESPQNEKTPFYPRSPYAIAKLFAHWSTINHRDAYNLFCVSGILFNHDSPLREPEFVTRKITSNIVNISRGKQEFFSLGNIHAKRDWGYAEDYVHAMYLMLQQKKPEDYVISSGETHSVKEFVELGFKYINMNLSWKGEGVHEVGYDQNGKVRVKIDPQFYRLTDIECLRGDSSKAKEKLGWENKTTFKQLVEIMMKAEFENI